MLSGSPPKPWVCKARVSATVVEWKHPDGTVIAIAMGPNYYWVWYEPVGPNKVEKTSHKTTEQALEKARTRAQLHTIERVHEE